MCLCVSNCVFRKLCDIGKSLERHVADIKDNNIPTPYKKRICGPPASWKFFHRQSEAFEYVHKYSQDVSVFSYESETFTQGCGQRMYVVANNSVFWHYYSQLQETQKHHYEVITEGAVCKLHFDLEFDKSLNINKDGNHMVNILVKYVCACLLQTFGIYCIRSDVLDFSASTDLKFSRHLIFLLPNAAFKDNIHAGHFVISIMTILQHHLAEQRSEPLNGVSVKELSCLLVFDKHGKLTTFCDLGIYTKNRNFRLYQSCKLKKKNPLVVSPENQFPIESLTTEQIFLDSLINNVKYSPDLKILTYEAQKPSARQYNTLAAHSLEKPHTTTNVGKKPSPYPQIDDFITSLVTTNGAAGYIRCWTYFSQDRRLVYDIARYRWCGNIGREHRSNNIIKALYTGVRSFCDLWEAKTLGGQHPWYIVDIKSGVYYQKCHDPDCKQSNYKSPDTMLPSHLVLDNEDWEDEIDDETLMKLSEIPVSKTLAKFSDEELCDFM